MALSHRKKTVGKRATTASSPPGDNKIKRRKRCVANIGFINGASPSLAFKRDLSEAFVGQYLCSARHKQNINTLQNIKMQDNESLREFVKRFGQAVLQVKAYNMDVVLQIFKRSIGPSTPFFESFAKKPPTTMDDLFRRASKYSMLEDDVRTATQQILVVGQASRGGAERSAKLPDRPRPSDRRWPRPLKTDPSKRDHSKKCAYCKEHGHTTEACKCLHYLVKRLIQAGHLKQYLRSDARGRDASRNHNSGTLRALAAPKVVINYINGGPLNEEYDSKRKRQRLVRAASPHRDALILSLEIGDFDVRRILVDPGSSADLVQASVISHMGCSLAGLENPGQILSGFNGASTTSLGDIALSV
eukprot:XP_010655174.1 PREDICTED: uncharacterized protein LOC104880395 [Vitis vinifera]